MYRATQRQNRRPAITLVELLVVIGIMTVLATIGTIAMSHWQEDKRTSGAVEQLSQWLLTAKSRAQSDGRPTGVRFLINNNGGVITAREFQYVQEPEDITGDLVPANPATDRRLVSITPTPAPPTPPTASVATFSNNVDFIGGAQAGNVADYLVQPGDYLQYQGGGSVHYIGAVLAANVLQLTNPNVTFNVQGGTANFRIYRAPRPLAGEEKMTLPDGMQVVISRPNSPNPLPDESVGLNQRSGWYEIVFSPGGELVGAANGGGQIIVWVEDTEADPGDLNAISLIAIKARTGFISSHPMGPPANPYVFTRDGQSSGI
jgi:type II secretory pathway pseudopilin PulG